MLSTTACLFAKELLRAWMLGPRLARRQHRILQNTHNGVAFTKEFDAIMEDIRTAALKGFYLV